MIRLEIEINNTFRREEKNHVKSLIVFCFVLIKNNSIETLVNYCQVDFTERNKIEWNKKVLNVRFYK